ncbi:type II secretion system protein GspK [Aliiglaciecola sp. CAU 1673]|uniref:general secretion pathway protein GspK n=1 Tax=Aliiglaciecola sp. CAU 1673 TaxID=3032595 RepID=UPI0023D9F6EF|nr:type II secretion system protein GspK [Aliiglaciecola sp. CAU 1673]MDF2177513.1 type II secretion system protein GspK [Aliiglaciecola sp. CAU 1673]
MNKQSGVALISALVTAIVMALVVALFSWQSRLALSDATAMLEKVEAEYLAEDALAQIQYLHLKKQYSTEPVELPGGWNYHGQVFALNENINVRIRDASSLLPVTPLNFTLFKQLVARLSGSEKLADTLEAQAKDWTDGDDLVHLNGMEQRDYQLLGKPLPRNADMQSFEELLRLPAMNESLWQQLLPYLTPFEVGNFNYIVAPEAIVEITVGQSRAEQIIKERGALSESDLARMFETTGLADHLSFSPSNTIEFAVYVDLPDVAAYRKVVFRKGDRGDLVNSHGYWYWNEAAQDDK